MSETTLFDDHGDSGRLQAALFRYFGEKVATSWMSDLECVEINDECITLSTEFPFRRDTLAQRFAPQLKDALKEAYDRQFRSLRIVTRRSRLTNDARRIDDLAPGASARAPVEKRAAPRVAERRTERRAMDEIYSPIDPRATFDAYAVDESNEMAYAAARHVFAEGAHADITYLNGPSGVGKTHLLFAVANEHRRRFGAEGCAYLTYSALQSGTVNAVFTNNVPELQRDLLSKDVVLIDDVHLLAGSTRTQTELLNLIDAALASGRRIVIAGELTPQKLVAAGFNERLAGRLSGGLCAPLLPGDAAHRARVLRRRIEMTETTQQIEDGAISYIAEKFPQNLRETLGALKQLQLAYRDSLDPIGRAEAEKTLRTRAMDSRRAPSFEEVAAAVAAGFGLSLEEFRSRGQYQRLVRARHAFVIICREHLSESFTRIAKFLGRDHTTIMSGYRRGQALLERDKQLRAQFLAVNDTLGLAAK
jgi:chromosomal replication initiator protein